MFTVTIGSKAFFDLAAYDDSLRRVECGLSVVSYSGNGRLVTIEAEKSDLQALLIDMDERASVGGGYEHSASERRSLGNAAKSIRKVIGV